MREYVNLSVDSENKLRFSGRLCDSLPLKVSAAEIELATAADSADSHHSGHFLLNNQRFSKWNVKSRFIYESNEENLLHLQQTASPYFLNLYAFGSDERSSCVYLEPFLCSFEDLVMNRYEQQQSTPSSSSPALPLVTEMSGLFQLVSLCVALHASELHGFLAIYGKHALVFDEEGCLKLPSIAVLLDSTAFPLDWNTLPHEVFLEDLSENEVARADVWALGSLLFKLFYGKEVINLEGGATSGSGGSATAKTQ